MPIDFATVGYATVALLSVASLVFRRRRAERIELVSLFKKGKLLNSTPISQTLSYKLTATDAAGNPDATFAQAAAVTINNPNVISATPSTLEPGGTIVVTGLIPGTATLTVNAGPGPLTTEVNITVTSGPAVSIALVPIALTV